MLIVDTLCLTLDQHLTPYTPFEVLHNKGVT